MSKSSLEYFNGISARSVLVNLVIIDNHIQIFDRAESGNLLATASFRDCSISFLSNVMFFYLDGTKTNYFIVPPDHYYYQVLKDKIKSFSSGWFNKLMSFKGVSLLGLFITLLLLVYTLFVSVVPWIGLKMISVPREIELGKNFYGSYIKDVEEDTTATLFAQQFADKIHLSPNYPIRVTVVKDSTVNAFAMPGGYIIVYSGILKKIHSSKEFAALLGHESTHINQRHGMRSLLRSVSSSLLFSIILNDVGNVSGTLVQNADQLRRLSFSRSLEQEADAKGMEIMIHNKIDPSGMKSLMEDLQKANKELPETFSFISTHPLTVERIKSADSYLNRHPNTFANRLELDDLWEKLSNR